MTSKFFLYLMIVPLVAYGMSSLNINGIFNISNIEKFDKVINFINK